MSSLNLINLTSAGNCYFLGFFSLDDVFVGNTAIFDNRRYFLLLKLGYHHELLALPGILLYFCIWAMSKKDILFNLRFHPKLNIGNLTEAYLQLL